MFENLDLDTENQFRPLQNERGVHAFDEIKSAIFEIVTGSHYIGPIDEIPKLHSTSRKVGVMFENLDLCSKNRFRPLNM